MANKNEIDYSDYKRKIWIEFGQDLCLKYKKASEKEKRDLFHMFKKYLLPSEDGRLFFHPQFVMNQIVHFANSLEKYRKDDVISFINLPIIKQMEYIYESTKIDHIPDQIQKDVDEDFDYIKESVQDKILSINSEFESNWADRNTNIMNNFAEYTMAIDKISNNTNLEMKDLNFLLLSYYLELVEGSVKSHAFILIDLILRRDGEFIYYQGDRKRKLTNSNFKRISKISLSSIFDVFTSNYNIRSFKKYVNLKLRNNIAHNLFKFNNEQIILDNNDVVDDMREECNKVRFFSEYFNTALREFMSEGWDQGAKELIENICEEVERNNCPFLDYL